MTTNDAMTALCRAAGKTIEIDGKLYRVESARPAYGTALIITLDRPRSGRTSRILRVEWDADSPCAQRLASTLA